MPPPLCVVRVTPQPALDSLCRLDGSVDKASVLCAHQGECVPLATAGTFSPDLFPPQPQTCGVPASPPLACTSGGHECPAAQPVCGVTNVCLSGCAVGSYEDCILGTCGQKATCSAGACSQAANSILVAQGVVASGATPTTSAQFACTAAEDPQCTCAPGFWGPLCTLTTQSNPGGAECTASTPGCDCVAGVCAPCAAGWTGLDCATPTEVLKQGTCACTEGWTGPGCDLGAGAPTEVWCRGDDAAEALAAYKTAQAVCLMNSEFSAQRATIPSTTPPTPCVDSRVPCVKNTDCPGRSLCSADHQCTPLPCNAGETCAAGAHVCTIPLNDLAGAACDPVMNGASSAPVGALNLSSSRMHRVPIDGAPEGRALTLRNGECTDADLQLRDALGSDAVQALTPDGLVPHSTYASPRPLGWCGVWR